MATDMMVFSAKRSKVAPLEASSCKGKPKTATNMIAIRKPKPKAVYIIEGSEMGQLLSP